MAGIEDLNENLPQQMLRGVRAHETMSALAAFYQSTDDQDRQEDGVFRGVFGGVFGWRIDEGDGGCGLVLVKRIRICRRVRQRVESYKLSGMAVSESKKKPAEIEVRTGYQPCLAGIRSVHSPS